MSPERIAARKRRLMLLRQAALKNWEMNCHEGDIIEQDYFIRGYIAAMNEMNILNDNDI